MSPSTRPVDLAQLYAQQDDSRGGLLVGAAVAIALHGAMFVPMLLSTRTLPAEESARSKSNPTALTSAQLPPKAIASPSPTPSAEKVTAPEGEELSAKLPVSTPLPASKRTTTEAVKRTPAPPPAPTTAPAGMDKASAITMAWISAEAFEELVAEKGHVEQAGFQRVATPVPGAPMRTDPVPIAARKETAGGEMSMQGSPGEAQQATPAAVARPSAKPTDETKGPPPAQGMGADRVVQLEGKANDLPMKTSTPQGVTWDEPAVKTGPLAMGEVLPGQGKASDQISSAPRLGAQRGNVAAAPNPSLKEAPNPTADGKGRVSPGFTEAQPAVKEVAVSPAQPSVAQPTVVGKPVVPIKEKAGDSVPLGDAPAATEVVSNQQAQRVGDRAQEARKEVLPQRGQEAREARPAPTGTADDAKSPPRAGIAEDVIVEGARSAPIPTLTDKATATGGQDDHSAGDGALAMVVPNPKKDESAEAKTAPGRPGIGSDRPEKPSEKSPDPNSRTPAPVSEQTPAASPAQQTGRPSAVAQGAEHGGEKPRITSLPKSDREAPPVSLSPEPIKLRPGTVLTGEGIEIRTVMPRLSVIAQVTSLPANPEVKVTFARSGKVVNAEMLRSTGYPNWDGPIISSLYLWTVKGERFERINGPVEFKFVILISD